MFLNKKINYVSFSFTFVFIYEKVHVSDMAWHYILSSECAGKQMGVNCPTVS